MAELLTRRQRAKSESDPLPTTPEKVTIRTLPVDPSSAKPVTPIVSANPPHRAVAPPSHISSRSRLIKS